MPGVIVLIAAVMLIICVPPVFNAIKILYRNYVMKKNGIRTEGTVRISEHIEKKFFPVFSYTVDGEDFTHELSSVDFRTTKYSKEFPEARRTLLVKLFHIVPYTYRTILKDHKHTIIINPNDHDDIMLESNLDMYVKSCIAVIIINALILVGTAVVLALLYNSF